MNLLQLDDDSIQIILLNLDPSAILSCNLICTKMRNIVHRPTFWHRFLAARFPSLRPASFVEQCFDPERALVRLECLIAYAQRLPSSIELSILDFRDLYRLAKNVTTDDFTWWLDQQPEKNLKIPANIHDIARDYRKVKRSLPIYLHFKPLSHDRESVYGCDILCAERYHLDSRKTKIQLIDIDKYMKGRVTITVNDAVPINTAPSVMMKILTDNSIAKFNDRVLRGYDMLFHHTSYGPEKLHKFIPAQHRAR